jgi:ERCC4-related helicase
MAFTDYHAKYYAHHLSCRVPEGLDRISRSLFDAAVDLNPHQIEAALFALNSPLSKGVILADEVGLGKTIEAGIVLCQFWAERKRRLLVVTPASIRKQWALELEEKFNLPATVLDAKAYNALQKAGNPRPFDQKSIVIVSLHFAARYKEEIRSIPWDLVVIDEAHKLRNSYRPGNRIGQAIRWGLENRRKLLLTATPLQNSLLEIYGLATLIDDMLFGDLGTFRSQYTNAGADLDGLRHRLSHFCKRTLRNQVSEYVSYTERRPITRPFTPTDAEQAFYNAVSRFLQREESYAIPAQRRHLTVLILRKLLASSVDAIAATLATMLKRLVDLRDGHRRPADLATDLIEQEELEEDLLEEFSDEETTQGTLLPEIDIAKLTAEIKELEILIAKAKAIGAETKNAALLTALDVGFRQMAEMTPPAPRKALLFTESRRTQDALKALLEKNGYAGQVLLFNGTNGGPEVKAIYEDWVRRNANSGRVSGSRSVDSRTALIEHFRDHVPIMIATEAAAEGVNLQFCSLVINYDLPWNPQRIEQRIGRCHRYGQKHDVVVINFLNSRNAADCRVHQLLEEKFKLFNGVFGASDEVLGAIESGVDFEKRILSIYQDCRTPAEIEDAFNKLRDELDESIQARMADTRQKLLDNFDEDVHERLKLELAETQSRLDAFGRRFWALSRHILNDRAQWRDSDHSFLLDASPLPEAPPGRYFLINKSHRSSEDSPADEHGHYLYRLSHPLGEWVTQTGKHLDTPWAEVIFDSTNHPARISLVEALKGRSGLLRLSLLTIQSFAEEQYLLFSAFDHEGQSLYPETCEKLFSVAGRTQSAPPPDPAQLARLDKESARHAEATLSRSLETNNKHFAQARERLDKWADDCVLAAEQAIQDTKTRILALRREARQAITLEEQKQAQEQIQALEKKKRRQRHEIFDVEDEIERKRDTLITDLEKRISQSTDHKEIFTIRWRAV